MRAKSVKARAVFYWGIHTRFTVSVGVDLRHAVLEVPIVYAWTRELELVLYEKLFITRIRASYTWQYVKRVFTEYPTYARTVVPRPFFSGKKRPGATWCVAIGFVHCVINKRGARTNPGSRVFHYADIETHPRNIFRTTTTA